MSKPGERLLVGPSDLRRTWYSDAFFYYLFPELTPATRFIEMDPSDLTDDLIYQIGALQALAQVAGTGVRYVKPHGALYNAIVHHHRQAQAVIDAVRAVDPGLPVLGPPGSALLELAEQAGLRAVPEAFADRGYSAQGTLIPRNQPGALLSEPAAVAARMVRLVTEGVITAVDGTDVKVDAESICVHGDSPGAVDMAATVRQALLDTGIIVRAFA